MDAVLLPRTDRPYELQFPHAFSSSVRTPQLLIIRKSVWKTRERCELMSRGAPLVTVLCDVRLIPASKES